MTTQSRRVPAWLAAAVLVAGMAAGCRTDARKSHSPNEYLTQSVLWYRWAAECRALQIQAYNVARARLEEALKTPTARPRAVVLDLDETVLDNGPFEAALIVERGSPSRGWNDWCRQARAGAVAGAVEFLQFADEKGVSLYYVSNRSEALRACTLENLRKLGIPQATDEHLRTKGRESSKESRRKDIAETHDIVLLIGDNLCDFSADFDEQPTHKRAAEVERLKAEFGKRWIILPNPIYGDWEAALFHYRRDISPDDRRELQLQWLEP